VSSQAPKGLRPWQRVPLLMLAFAGLLAGVGAGLARLGWAVPELSASASTLHGPLMICGFFGTVIALERAVAIGRLWAYFAPLAAGLGGVAAVAGITPLAQWLILAAGGFFLAASLDVFRRQKALFTFTMALGAAAWLAGSTMWVEGSATSAVVPWWLAFLILTIAGERLELSRFLPPSRTARAFFITILGFLCAGLLTLSSAWGVPLFAGSLLALALWLVRQDIARRTVRKSGLTRYVAVCLLAGYGWLALGAAAMLHAGALSPGTPAYDAALHALALGFVFSMVFGHAPIIFPAVLRVAVPYHPVFYLPLALLHGSLAVRIAGDAFGRFDWVRGGGAGNGFALAAFIAVMIGTVVRGWRRA
jgi:hypothetical protein